MKNEFYTPKNYIELVKDVLGEIILDPFSCEYANKNFVKATYFYDKKISCYNEDWIEANKGTVFMNPPYSNGEYKPAIERFIQQLNKFKFEAITLTNNNTETIASQLLMKRSSAICYPDKRINYHTMNGETNGNRYSQMFCYFGNNVKQFNRVFGKIGTIFINPLWLKSIL